MSWGLQRSQQEMPWKRSSEPASLLGRNWISGPAHGELQTYWKYWTSSLTEGGGHSQTELAPFAPTPETKRQVAQSRKSQMELAPFSPTRPGPRSAQQPTTHSSQQSRQNLHTPQPLDGVVEDDAFLLDAQAPAGGVTAQVVQGVNF